MAGTKEIVIQGEKFTVGTPYDAGHTLTEAEARALNQVRLENIRNNLASRVAKALEGGEGAPSLDEVRAYAVEYDGKYDFSQRAASGAGARKLDPVEREARKLAREAIAEHLREQGRKLSDVPEGSTKEEWEAKLDETISQVAADDNILRAAKKIVNDRQKAGRSAIANIFGNAGAASAGTESADQSTEAQVNG
jgi:hypothetical protein